MDFFNLPAINFQVLENSRLFGKLDSKLKEDTVFKPMLDYAEKSTKINRVYLVTGFAAVLVFFLLAEFGTAVITGCIGFLYPGYKTLTLLQHTYDVESGRRWLIYWFLHSALNFVEIFLFFLDWLPIYWVIKCFFLFWCYAPLPINGADVLYIYMIQPFFQRNQEVIDNAFNHMVRSAHTIYTEAERLVPTQSSDDHLHQN
ncbi:hypothetical protein JTE90_001054 [Oedothorax gibbosus]|uniref:Receptor expression-enhancing protein n=1 Tax=Oedothorax gibbosus TaxID=931172 RepID=A0AAV6UIB8_9ARAC|nr:hypothetical protein JTE90_001054 [Oedothorax gibbosus]